MSPTATVTSGVPTRSNSRFPRAATIQRMHCMVSVAATPQERMTSPTSPVSRPSLAASPGSLAARMPFTTPTRAKVATTPLWARRRVPSGELSMVRLPVRAYELCQALQADTAGIPS